MNNESVEISKTVQRPRKANECIIDPKKFSLPAPLFDKFWHEGELALFFGAAGTGKSVLAVQIADALARGRGLSGFQMPKGRRKVLYVDLEHSDAQFQARYTATTARASVFKFSENLHRDRPSSNDDLCEWVRTMVLENGFRVVIIDDLSAIKQTNDGTRETLKIMRRLKQLKEELEISILVVTDADSPRQFVTEADLKRSRVLCCAADSVFAIGEHWRFVNRRCLIQTRSRSAAIFWHKGNAPDGKVVRLDSGMLGFEFDKRFAPRMDEETRLLIWNVKLMRDCGVPYRFIAKELEISKSRAARLFKKWTPAMELEDWPDKLGEEKWGSDEVDEDEWEDEETGEESEMERQGDGESLNPRGMDVEAIPWAAGLARRSVYDLNPGYDGYGRKIFIESEDRQTRKPTIWYQFDKKGNKLRYERKSFGVDIERLGTSPYL